MQSVPWVFHPFEMAFVGYKDTGKTTLLASLAARLGQAGFQVGYLKHDAHGFQMDRPGKDTEVLARAGAALVAISDQDRQAVLRTSPRNPIRDLDLLEPDLLLVEGHKNLRLPRIALLDAAGSILSDPALLELPPLAVVHPGPCPALPWDVPRFHRDDQDGIGRFVQQAWAARAAAVPLFGVVLTGGRSTRMGRDKAQLETGGTARRTGPSACWPPSAPGCSFPAGPTRPAGRGAPAGPRSTTSCWTTGPSGASSAPSTPSLTRPGWWRPATCPA